MKTIDSSVGNLKDCVFKIPEKRRLKQGHLYVIQAKRDSSERSVLCSLPPSGFLSKIYSVKDIKSFLKMTKMLEFIFPRYTTVFRSQGQFSDKGIYWLKTYSLN